MKAHLRAERETLPATSFFGDPNHEIIDYQLDVLDFKLIDEDSIYDLEEELGEGNHSAVLDALFWLQGDLSTEDFKGE